MTRPSRVLTWWHEVRFWRMTKHPSPDVWRGGPVYLPDDVIYGWDEWRSARAQTCDAAVPCTYMESWPTCSKAEWTTPWRGYLPEVTSLVWCAAMRACLYEKLWSGCRRCIVVPYSLKGRRTVVVSSVILIKNKETWCRMFDPMWIGTFALNIFIHREVIRLILYDVYVL